jgi:hypothetical protein
VLGESNIVAVVGWQIADTNGPMVEAWKKIGIPAYFLRPFETRLLGPGDVGSSASMFCQHSTVSRTDSLRW